MGSDDGVNSSGCERLNEIIAEYLRAAESGEAPDRQEFLDRHEDLADELKSFFADHDKVKELAATKVSVKFDGTPMLGVIIFLLAGIILFGGAALAMYSIFAGRSEEEERQPKSD